ncbi:MAG: ExbD/TolR family protein [Syntrophaceae bacterium]
MEIRGNSRHKIVSGINVTPLVDVMLVLLIIFMVSAPMMKEGMRVDLPEVESRALPTQSEDLMVTIGKNRVLDINGSTVGLDRLAPLLQQIKEQRGIDNVYLQADKGVPYGFVVEVMSVIRGAGLSKLGLVTQPPLKKEG